MAYEGTFVDDVSGLFIIVLILLGDILLCLSTQLLACMH